MKHMGSLIALLSGLAITMAAWLLLTAMTDDARESRFEQECSLLNSRMQTQLDQQVLMLRGLEKTLSSYVDIVRDVFELAVSVPGNSQSGITSIGYASIVPRTELASYVDYVRRSAHPGFYIHPEGLREMYFPIQYVVSRMDGDSLLGLDLLSMMPVDAAMDTTQTIHVVDLVVENAVNNPGESVMLALSVRTQPPPSGSRGTCFVILDPRAVLASALTYSYDSSRIAFSVTGGQKDRRVLFSPSSMPGNNLVHHDSLWLGDAAWPVEYRARATILQAEKHELPSILLIVGILFSTIIFILIRIVENRLRNRSD
jgi:CHASE1-domain containing sensor protein